MRKRTAGVAAAAVTVALVVTLGGCGGGGDDGGAGDGGEASPTAEPTQTGETSPTPGPTESPTATVAGAPQAKLRSSDDVGKYLTDAKGRTLYLFVKDSSAESTCYEACAKAWPPWTVSGEPEAGQGVNADMLGTSERTDGRSQVTYNGHPLYYYRDDQEPGDLVGQGLDQFGARWWVVDASGNAARSGDDRQEPPPGQEQPEEDQDGGYGY